MQINICIISNKFANSNFILNFVSNQHKMDNIITKEDAKPILQPHLPTLNKIMVESLEELNVMNGMSVKLNSRTRCTLLHNIAIEKAIIYFQGVVGVSIKKKYQSIQIVIDDKIIGRIKKLNKNKLSNNIQTNRNDDILGQNTLFPGMAKITFVDFGYNTQSSWLTFTDLNVVCRLFDSVNWFIDFGNENNDVRTIEVTEPVTPLVKKEVQIQIKKTN